MQFKKLESDLHMLICLFRTVEQFLNSSMQARQAALLVGEGIIDASISPRRDNVKLGIKDVDAIHNAIKSWHCECLMAFILPHRIGTAVIGQNNQISAFCEQYLIYSTNASGSNCHLRLSPDIFKILISECELR